MSAVSPGEAAPGSGRDARGAFGSVVVTHPAALERLTSSAKIAAGRRVKMRPPVDLNLALAQQVTPFAQRIGLPVPYEVVGLATATKPFTASDKRPHARALVFRELDLYL